MGALATATPIERSFRIVKRPIGSDHALATAVAWEAKTIEARRERRSPGFIASCEQNTRMWFDFALLASEQPDHPDLPLVAGTERLPPPPVNRLASRQAVPGGRPTRPTIRPTATKTRQRAAHHHDPAPPRPAPAAADVGDGRDACPLPSAAARADDRIGWGVHPASPAEPEGSFR